MRKHNLGLITSRLSDAGVKLNISNIYREADDKNIGVLTFYVDEDITSVDKYPETLYMLDYNKIGALIIDATAIDNESFIKILIEKADSLNKSVFIIGKKVTGAVCVYFEATGLEVDNASRVKLARTLLDCIDDVLEGKKVSLDNPIEAKAAIALEDTLDLSVLREQIEKLYQEKREQQATDGLLYYLSENFPKVSQIREISDVIEKGIPSEGMLIVRDTFMQDVFEDAYTQKIPDKNDKYYIIADTREDKKTWEAFLLGELCPDISKMLRNGKPIVIFPVCYHGVQYGYYVYNTEDFDVLATALEKFVLVFNSIIGRYVSDRKFTFTNNAIFHASDDIHELKKRDILTGMFNIRGFLQAIEGLKEECLRTRRQLVMGCMDIERLGDINDVYGHSEGDVAIQALGTMISDGTEENAICGHIGSDEFVYATITDAAPEKIMDVYFKALIARVDNYNRVSNKDYELEVNHTYMSLFPSGDSDMKQFLDDVLAKKRRIKLSRKTGAGKQLMNPADEFNAKDEQMVNDIIDNNRFKYAFQPIVSAKTGDVYAYEALMRTDTEEFVSPLTILKYAAKCGRLYEIEHATFSNVFKRLSKEDIGPRKVFVNSIPGFLLSENDYKKMKNKFGSLYDNLVVEITEQTELDDDCLNTLKERSKDDGFRVAIDDFGSGYSNTSNLLRFLPNYVKIDRLLITDIQDDPKKQHFVKNIIEFAHDNGFYALAEGVETSEELAAVIHMGVDLIQGFYTAKPSFEFMLELPIGMQDEIISDNAEMQVHVSRKVFSPHNEKEIFVTRLALEDYSGVIISQADNTLVGNPDYTADFQIRVLDNCEVNIIMRDLHLARENDQPCIDIGNNATVHLFIEGENSFEGTGIRVPQSSKLVLHGEGKLSINCNCENAYAIGNDWHGSFGSIESQLDGMLYIDINGYKSIGIGGGTYNGGDGIRILRGMVQLHMASTQCVGIGSVYNEVPIGIKDCNILVNYRSKEGIGIGVWNGTQNVDIRTSKVEVVANGRDVCAIGSIEGQYGEVTIAEGHVIARVVGSNVIGIGNVAGGFKYVQRKARVELSFEANVATCVGAYDESGDVTIEDALISIEGKCGKAVVYGAIKENQHFIDASQEVEMMD